MPTPAPPTPPAPGGRSAWQRACTQVRQRSLALAAGLSAEDQALQSMPDTSPTKWHLAHTTWFFETLVLQPHAPGYRPLDARWAALFNSYYESLGPRHPRPQRGLLSRPSLAEVLAYRAQVDAALQQFIAQADGDTWAAAAPTLRLGLHHEQQHQELLLTDILHAFSLNPLHPAYAPGPGSPPAATATTLPTAWLRFDGGLAQAGAEPATLAGDLGDDPRQFAFDNERPRHTVWLAPFEIAQRLVTNAEFAAFIADGGYRRPALWLSDGWAQAQAQGWQAPLHWVPCVAASDGLAGFEQFSLHGLQPLHPHAPVCHLSGYEAAAYAAWAGARLPTEFEWEHAALQQPQATQRQAPGWWDAPDGRALLPQPAPAEAGAAGLQQALGEVWQWTSSAHAPYPGFKPLPGPAAEYNGKFMVNQLVLRGSSLATPPGHARLSYRNFFPPGARWQFSGLRLARDV